MLFNKENKTFELMFNDCINGNLLDFQNQLNKLNKKSLAYFIIFLKDNEVDNYTYSQVIKALNKEYR